MESAITVISNPDPIGFILFTCMIIYHRLVIGIYGVINKSIFPALFGCNRTGIIKKAYSQALAYLNKNYNLLSLML